MSSKNKQHSLSANFMVLAMNLEKGQAEQEIDLGDEYFGEGLCRVGDKLIQLTWQENKLWNPSKPYHPEADQSRTIHCYSKQKYLE